MKQSAILTAMLVSTVVASGQTVPQQTTIRKPTCSQDAICFSGQVLQGERFRMPLNTHLDFVLEPGWTIAIVPHRPEGTCQELASVVNPPYRAHRDLDIDTSYGWTAEEEIAHSPREFRFVTNCNDYHIESERLNIVLWGYKSTEQQYQQALAQLGTSATGTGRLWIMDWVIDHSKDTTDRKLGAIQWMTFSVEIRLPQTAPN